MAPKAMKRPPPPAKKAAPPPAKKAATAAAKKAPAAPAKKAATAPAKKPPQVTSNSRTSTSTKRAEMPVAMKKPASASVELDDSEESEERGSTELRAMSRSAQVLTSPQARPKAVWPPEARQTPVLHLASGRFKVDYDTAQDKAQSQSVSRPALIDGLCYLKKMCLLSDFELIAKGGARFQVHRLVLAAHSAALREKTATATELNLDYVSEAVDIFVRWSYGELADADYRPSSRAINTDVLRLVHELGLNGLSELAGAALAKGTSVETFVADVRLCEAYGLPDLREALVKAIVADKASLDIVARDPDTLQHPQLMRELLAGLAGSPC